MRRAFRTALVLVTWPIIRALDWRYGASPVARFSTGMRWARTGERQDQP